MRDRIATTVVETNKENAPGVERKDIVAAKVWMIRVMDVMVALVDTRCTSVLLSQVAYCNKG